ncbi:unnamed protein product [Coffea canephora]|uniref:NB-ARC domain-containing protein n=1 Tax=Coffea canephora TaxID=49390 RepID=A0A068V4F1_COFCA|nr:unnamed protein product [Coffea canephora]
MCMEEVGNWYFTILLDRNLFQDAKRDAYGNVLNCKMHDLVHDMAQFISECKTLRLKESTEADFHDKTFRYLAMERSDGEEMLPFPQKKSFRYITTLFLLENRSIDDGLIIFLACLQVLNIASSDAMELPKSIGKLSHLRYLDSSDTPMETLPDSLCKLYNLQTLRLRDCKSLTKFPNNFKKLVNLRHFDFFHKHKSSDLTPLEIGQLRSLQTLPFFNIGKEVGRQIGQLESLKNLSGSFEIRNLQLVTSMEEAKSAKLIDKPNIDELTLLWNEIEIPRENDSECNQVLEGLHAHQNLKGLMIQGFFGDQLSTWIAELPTLGHMPFLRSLHLEGLNSITSIGPSFYGGSGMHSSSSNQRPPNLIPALEYLILKDMQNLREWMEAPVHDGTVAVFPVLHTMRIYYCPQLATFQIIFHIAHLKLSAFPRDITCRGLPLARDNFNPQGTQIPHSLATKWDSTTSRFSSSGTCPPLPLKELYMYSCCNLISFPIDLTRTPSLSYLEISKCKKLTDLPKGKLCSLTSLIYLYIGPFSETTTELHSFLDLFDALPPPHPYFPSLPRLFLHGWPHWESLPEQLQHLSTLTELRLADCPLLKERCNPESRSNSTDPNSESSKISHIPRIIIDWTYIRG